MATDLDERKLRIEEQRLEIERARDADSRRFLNRRLGAIVTAFISIATVALSVVQWRIATLRADREAIAAEIRAKRDFDMETYKLITASLARRDTAEQLAALRLIALVNDSGVRQGLLEALTRSGLQVVRDSATEQQTVERRFATEQGAVSRPLAGNRGEQWRYDVFLCEGAPQQAVTLADQVVAALKAMPGEVRLRTLPRSVNLRPGYQVTGYEVRHESSEVDQARRIVARLNALGDIWLPFRMVSVSNRTPRYLSVFLCP